MTIIIAPCKHCLPDEVCQECGSCERYKIYRKGVMKEKEKEKRNAK